MRLLQAVWTRVYLSFHRSKQVSLPEISLPSSSELTSLRFDKVVDFMATWMSTQSDGLSALAQKIDGLEVILQKAESMYSGKELRPATVTARSNTNSSAPSQHDVPGSWPPSIRWPQVTQLLSDAAVHIDEENLIIAEDRPVLRLRSYTSVDDGSEEKENYLPDDGNKSCLQAQAPSARGLATSVDLQARTVRSLFDGFLAHIDEFHSFIDGQQMRNIFSHSFQRYSSFEGLGDDGAGLNHFSRDGPRLSKRRKIESAPTRGLLVDRSLSAALILISLALGEVVKYPGPLPNTSDSFASSGNGSEHKSPLPVPGIAYFAAAISIMGDHMDGHEIIHAQLFLLAGLYKAQLARVREASSWYALAGRVLTHLIHRRRLFDDHNPKAPQETPCSSHPCRSRTDDLILCAAWACLHFEDEILPELGLPRSGLERLKTMLLLPRHATIETTAKQVEPKVSCNDLRRRAYSTRLQLQRTLHHVQIDLFSESSPFNSKEDVVRLFKRHATALQQWRSHLVPGLKWEDNDTAPNDILHSRLRHLYWEAKLTILRPFFYYALHKLSPGKSDWQADESTGMTDAQNHIVAAIDLMSRTSGQQEVQNLAQLGIAAAKHSLRAYDGINGRLIVSNVQHVAHGHFNNILMLISAHQSGSFSACISPEELKRHLDRTITFLKSLSPISPTAVVDCGILERLRQALCLST